MQNLISIIAQSNVIIARQITADVDEIANTRNAVDATIGTVKQKTTIITIPARNNPKVTGIDINAWTIFHTRATVQNVLLCFFLPSGVTAFVRLHHPHIALHIQMEFRVRYRFVHQFYLLMHLHGNAHGNLQ